ncbi:MAG: hypothetical protein RXS42_04045 [Nitrososphaeria archaeon]
MAVGVTALIPTTSGLHESTSLAASSTPMPWVGASSIMTWWPAPSRTAPM